MKEEYFNSSILEKSVDDLLAELTASNYRPKPWKLQPGKAALLVLDMQNYFLDPASHAFTPSAPAILPNIKKLILMARRLNMEIIFTRHVNDDANAGMMGKWWRGLIREDSEDCKTVGLYGDKQGYGEAGKRGQGDEETGGQGDRVTRRRGEEERRGMYDKIKVIIKHQYDAFYQTELEEYLRSKHAEQVIICGLLANLCCETTARSAFVRGFEVFFPVDATAAYNREFHLSTFRNLGFGFCPLIKTSELLSSVYED